MNIMKLIIALLSLFTASLYGQECIRELDICTKGSDLKFQTISNYWIEQIENKNPDELFKYWHPMGKLSPKTRKKLTKMLDKFSAKYLKNKPGHPGVKPYETKELFYERTFYSCDKSKIEYYAQLTIKCKYINGDYYIDAIELREGKYVVLRNEQINYIRSMGPTNPPPAPPPPPFEKGKN